MLKASQKRTKRAAFLEELMSSTPASTIGWLATMPTVRPSMRPKPQMMLPAWRGWISKKSPSSSDLADHFVHVIGLRGAGRDDRVEAHLSIPVPRIGAGPLGHFVAVRRGQEVEEIARGEQRVDIVLQREVGDRGLGRVRDRAAQFLLRDDFVGHRLDHVRAGHEHVRAVLHHEDEVGHRRRIDRAARAGPHDQADLRDHARGVDVALEDLGIAGQRVDAFLDARAAGIVEADHRRADLHRHVHDLADLLRVAFRHRAAEHGEVLR
jgi:hypothetical protein